jgi:hypothetical protein
MSIGYAVLQNETFRLYPQLGIHINFQNYNVSERSASIDASAIQPGMNQSWSTSMFSSSIGLSLGIGGDARIPLGYTYKLDTNPESIYKMDLLLGFQLAYNFGNFALISNPWNMNGARVNNLPGISPQGIQARFTFGSDMRLIK